MASSSSPCSSFVPFKANDGLISINAATQIPLKLTATNYPSWRAQFYALLIVYDLLGYVDVSESIISLIAFAHNSKDAWDKLAILFANKSHSQVMHLKEKLTAYRGTKPVPEYLRAIKAIVDELALIDSWLSDDDIAIYVLRKSQLLFVHVKH
ncbi:hypothetical protein GH714_026506 [Hevea brasiliensis]|uniref:Retrotransposon Copia-like N-terminal domain-containing protein n=1 Tax=Hevea brasiliensis TaxID=3981 RepID=A0A6A6NBI0_HEVBR|nr:hypothetical protein GH714_026506 [Hevea brasiliensis]